jgi:indolepyruvate ferredoxin oxidoreductase beta subunit
MKADIILSGVGGQGILTIAAIVGRAAVNAGINVKQSEVHGMAQRGGAVVAHLRLSDEPIYSDLIPTGGADVVLGVEPMEALRFAGHLAEGGVLLANSVPVRNIEYPDVDEILGKLRALPKHVVIDADAMAREAGSARAMNMVMLGALSVFLDFPEGSFEGLIREAFERKGEKVVETNLKALAAGQAAARE